MWHPSASAVSRYTTPLSQVFCWSQIKFPSLLGSCFSFRNTLWILAICLRFPTPGLRLSIISTVNGSPLLLTLHYISVHILSCLLAIFFFYRTLTVWTNYSQQWYNTWHVKTMTSKAESYTVTMYLCKTISYKMPGTYNLISKSYQLNLHLEVLGCYSNQ